MKKIAKRSILIATVICILMMNSIVNYAVSEDFKVFIDQVELVTDVKPFNTNGRIMVPLRAIFEAIGATVIWDPVDRTVTGVKGNKEVFLKIDNTLAKINGNEVQLDVPATIKDSRTFVPLRFVSESLEMDVLWEDSTKTVYITGKQTEIIEDIPTPTPEVQTPTSIIETPSTVTPTPSATSVTSLTTPNLSQLNSLPQDFKLIIDDKSYTNFVTYAVKIIDGQICINSILLAVAFDIHTEYNSQTRQIVLIHNDEILKTPVLDREWISINAIAQEKNMVITYESNTLEIKSNIGKQSSYDIVVMESILGDSINSTLTAIVHEFPVRTNGQTIFNGCRGMMIVQIENEEDYQKLTQFDDESLKRVIYDYIMANRDVFSDYVTANIFKFKEFIPVYLEVVYNEQELLNISIPDAATYEDVTLLNFIN